MKTKKLNPSEIINVIVSAVLVVIAAALLNNIAEFKDWFPVWMRNFFIVLLVILYAIMLMRYLDPKEQKTRTSNFPTLLAMYVIIAAAYIPLLFLLLKPVELEVTTFLNLLLLVG